MSKQVKLRFFLDTEFNDNATRFAIDPISIALVPEDHARANYYGVSSEFDESRIHPWLEENVIRQLPPRGERVTNDEIRDQIMDYVASFREEGREISGVEIWAYNGATDSVVLANFFGGLNKFRQAFNEAGLPEPVFREMKELTRATGKNLPKPEHAHDCEVDAVWTRALFEYERKLLKKSQAFLVA